MRVAPHDEPNEPGAPDDWRRRCVIGCSAAPLAGCGSFYRPHPAAIERISYSADCPTQTRALLVILPGAHMTAAELVREGFVQAVRAQHARVDVTIAEATLGQLVDGSVFERLRADVFTPALTRGRRLWVLGISLGAYLALNHARRHPGDIDTVIALAPYLGRRTLTDEVGAAGGARAWAAQATPTLDDVDSALWQWFAERPADAPAIYLGTGRDDRFAAAQRLLAAALPAEHVDRVDGGHDWAPWRLLWTRWLARGLLPVRCP